MSEFQDRDYLQKDQYRTSNNLAARADLHSRFNVSAEGWHEWAFAQLQLQADDVVLECGAGPGWLWDPATSLPARCTVILTDLSVGMVSEAMSRHAGHSYSINGAAADIQSLPFPANSFDTVIANHMLYHVPDLALGLSEVARVLRHSGRLVAATNGRDHMAKLFELGAEIFPDSPSKLRGAMQGLPFALENGGELLSQHFDQVELHLYESWLEVDDADALVSYLLSSSEAQQHVSSAEREAGVVRLQDQIRTSGPIHISKETGIFVATLPTVPSSQA